MCWYYRDELQIYPFLPLLCNGCNFHVESTIMNPYKGKVKCSSVFNPQIITRISIAYLAKSSVHLTFSSRIYNLKHFSSFI